jgi:hypothetical protein
VVRELATPAAVRAMSTVAACPPDRVTGLLSPRKILTLVRSRQDTVKTLFDPTGMSRVSVMTCPLVGVESGTVLVIGRERSGALTSTVREAKSVTVPTAQALVMLGSQRWTTSQTRIPNVEAEATDAEF